MVSDLRQQSTLQPWPACLISVLLKHSEQQVIVWFEQNFVYRTGTKQELDFVDNSRTLYSQSYMHRNKNFIRMDTTSG